MILATIFILVNIHNQLARRHGGAEAGRRGQWLPVAPASMFLNIKKQTV